jgi:hypothetical protein
MENNMEFVKRVNKYFKLAVLIAVITGIQAYLYQDLVKDRETNYFEVLKLDSTRPTTLSVKKNYQELMNEITSTTEAPKNEKGKKKKYKEMNEDEKKVEDKKRGLKKAYDCLMFSQCFT